MSDAGVHIEILDHTADIGMLVRARSLYDLHSGAGRAMMQLVCGHVTIAAVESHPLHLFGEDRQELMVNWLSELNFLLQTRQFLFARAEFSMLSDTEMRGHMFGEKINPMVHLLRMEIKAVTHHRIEVRQEAGGEWMTRVYFDV